MKNNLHIDHEKVFPQLAAAPIVEAILHWQAAATTNYFDADYLNDLAVRFPEYTVQPQHNLTTGIQGTQQGIAINHSNVVQGARIFSANQSGQQEFVCQFLRTGVIFSKLSTYSGWESFLEKASEFWTYFASVGKPNDITQLATRYISQIQIGSAQDCGEYIGPNCAPLTTLNLSANSFYHQDTIMLDTHPYGINVVRAAQKSPDGNENLIVDIAAYTNNTITDIKNLEICLEDLRFIKNEVFFSLMKDPQSNFGGIPGV